MILSRWKECSQIPYWYHPVIWCNVTNFMVCQWLSCKQGLFCQFILLGRCVFLAMILSRWKECSQIPYWYHPVVWCNVTNFMVSQWSSEIWKSIVTTARGSMTIRSAWSRTLSWWKSCCYYPVMKHDSFSICRLYIQYLWFAACQRVQRNILRFSLMCNE